MSSRAHLHAGVERTIARRFAYLVSAILVLAIASYAVVDLIASGARLDNDLARRAERFAIRVGRTGRGGGAGDLGEACVLDASGRVVRRGEGFPPLAGALPQRGYATLGGPDGDFRVYATGLPDGGSLLIAERARGDAADVLEKVLLLCAVSIGVTVLVYVIGLRFAKRSLEPVHATLARLDQFTADAGHELRTPLATIRAQMEVAERTGEYREGIAAATDEVERATALVERLLEIARLDSASLMRDDLDLGVVTRAAAGRAAEAAGGAAITTRGIDGVRVSADPVLLERLLANLIDNAVRFARPDSTVSIEWDRATLTVHNSGEPIPAEVIARVFDPFFQVDPSRAAGGFGLGLAIASRIATLHGWSLSASSDRSSGTTFTVTFGGRRP
ncbi:MAG: HAMP domain-containing sensor histidine kinase [Coriobacteriia bacterium]|nr:HAMP domain-containing sensor histidine kinase [Coriobacteriia bacterium]